MTSPPHDPQAEKSLLGVVLQFPNCISEISARVQPEDFYLPPHQSIYKAALTLWNEGNPVDPSLVLAELERDGKLLRVGGAPYVLDLLQSPLTQGAAPHYADIIAGKSKLRKIGQLGQRLQQATELDCDDAVEAVHRFLSELDYIQESDSDDFDSAYESWVNWYDTDSAAIPTPWPGLNTALLGGWHPGRLYVVAGRPGAGKSAMGLQAALQAAQAGYRSLTFSLEMPKEECLSRILAAGTSTPLKQLFTHRLSRESVERVKNFATNHTRPKGLRIDDSPSQTIESIMAKCRAAQQKGGLDLVVIDHTLLLTPSDRKQAVYQQVAHVGQQSKLLARRLGIAVILCHQLNRAIEKENRKPQMSDLREGIEADADAIIILTRGVFGITSTVLKNRMGRTGDEHTLSDELAYGRLG